MIVERGIGRLAKYTFDMGGAGDLLALSLNVPPWPKAKLVDLAPKLVPDRLVSTAAAISAGQE
jgi:hypothetical protein